MKLVIINKFSPIYALEVLLGIWLMAAPFVLSYNDISVAKRNDGSVGLVVMLIALARMAGPYGRMGWSWCNMLLGVWLVLSPFVLRFATDTAALWNHIITGVVIAILGWKGVSSEHAKTGG